MTTSHPDILGLVRLLRLLGAVLDAGLILAVLGSVIAFGAVHPWAYVPLWGLSATLAVAVMARAAVVRALRARLGGGPFTFHVSGRWVSAAGDSGEGWRFDLDRPVLGSVPLLVPGAAFVLLVLAQMVPLPADVRSLASPTHPVEAGWSPITHSSAATVRGLAFLLTLMGVHAAAGAAFTRSVSRDRLIRVVAFAVPVLGLTALFQNAAAVTRIYGFFKPREHGAIFGSFVNRNHFASWMAMATAIALGLVHSTWRRYAARVGERPNFRRRLAAMQSSHGTRLLATIVCVFVGVASLLASSSRGGILAFVAAAVIAIVGGRRTQGVPVPILAALLLALGAAWVGLDRLGTRFEKLTDDSPGRMALWKDSLQRLEGGEWVLGSGFNTFALKASRSAPFRLPVGATPWPVDVAPLAERGERIATRVLHFQPGNSWYREAHNEYVQTVVETGLLGLGIVGWAVLRTLSRARREPWRFAALAAGLLHAAVDFPFQIPAIAVLFVVIAAAHDRHAAD